MRTRICLSTLLALLCLPLFSAPAGAVEVGLVETLGQTKPTAETAAALGAGWVRLWATWEDAQPSGPGSWDAQAIQHANREVAKAKARGLKVLMVVHLS